MAKADLVKLETDRAALVDFAKYIMEYARYRDHALKLKCAAVLRDVGEGE